MQAPTEIRQLRRRASLWVEGIYEVSDTAKHFHGRTSGDFVKIVFSF